MLRRLALGVAVALLGLVVATVAYGALVVEPRIAPISAAAPAHIRSIVARHGGDYLSLRAMGTWLPRATIAVEDRRFYAHGPVDPLATLRAVWFDVRGGRPLQGGGTIDVQLAERLLPHNAGDPFIYEFSALLLADRLDRTYGKDGVLTLYLNDIYYGHGAYGGGAAARVFFGVPAARLTAAQASFLAGLPNLPAVYGDHPTSVRTLARWRIVLRSMVRAGQLTHPQADRIAQAGPPPLQVQGS